MPSNLILILNCGSSSIKFAILNPNNGDEYLSGLAECFNLPEARIKWKIEGQKKEAPLGAMAAHTEALTFIVNNILKERSDLLSAISAIGHRIVHGGEKFTQSVLITDEVVKEIEIASDYAPLHNPAHLIGLKAAFDSFPHLKDKNVAVFDTAFHQTMPEESYLYAIPYQYYRENGVRRYGAHGTSHYYVTCEAAKILNKPIDKVNVVTCHLGNGASITAVKNGKSIETSMGLTPLEGLVMGTRSGDIDPAIIFFLHDKLGKSVTEINDILNKKSGLLGLTEVSNDCRYVEDNYETKDEAKRAMNVFVHRLVKYIGAYSMLLDGELDAIIFTGGIGENSAPIREHVVKQLKILGCEIDHDRNLAARFGKGGAINKEGTRNVLVIPTNEELVIAQDTAKLTA